MNKEIRCPDCKSLIWAEQIREHILMCKTYNKMVLGSTVRLAESLNFDDLKFLMAQLEMARQTILNKLGQPLNPVKFGTYESVKQQNQIHKPIFEEVAKTVQLIHEPQVQPETIPYQPPITIYNSQQVTEKVVSDQIVCQNCEKKMDVNEVNLFAYNYACLHLLCIACIKSYVEDQYVAKKGKLLCLVRNCKGELSPDQIRQVIGMEEFDKLEAEVIRSTLQFTRCCKCKHQYQFTQGNPKDAPKTDQSGKKITKSHADHYAKNRFVCPNSACKQEQCKVCHTAPYHLGRTCSQNEEFKNSKKCRYCKNVLKKGYMSNLGMKAFDDVCERSECEKLTKKACAKIHSCKHPCLGYIKQTKCLPCLNEKCCKAVVQHDQDQDSYCSICYVEDLKASPCVMSKCGHIFHYSCLQKRLQIRWLTPRILFGFCYCPLCKEWISLPEDCPLSGLVNKNRQLYQSLKQKSENRLKFQKLEKDPKITDPKSNFYQKPADYAMAIYAYFQCFKCKKPYFGGRKSCADVMNEEGDSSSAGFDASRLVCPECCPVETKNCSKHGKQFLAFKCRFCCNIGMWFCWGSTHFCDDCHKRQLKGQYISKLPKQKLPKCLGKEKCPIGGEHGENGAQFSLGCMLCRNYKTQIRDF